METAQQVEKITVETFRNMYFDDEEGYYYELMEGEVIKRSAPATVHQRISRILLVSIDAYIGGTKNGEIFSAPMDVFLDSYNLLQPDLIYISDEQKSIIAKDGIKGGPALVIEILSPSSVIRDRINKKRIYERNGVKEYWLVSPEYQEIEVFVLKNHVYELFSAATSSEGELKSEVLKDLKLDLKTIFNNS